MESRDEAAPFHRTWKTPPKPPPAFPTPPTAPATRKRRSRGTKTKTTFVKSVTYVPGLTCYLCSRSYRRSRMRGVQDARKRGKQALDWEPLPTMPATHVSAGERKLNRQYADARLPPLASTE